MKAFTIVPTNNSIEVCNFQKHSLVTSKSFGRDVILVTGAGSSDSTFIGILLSHGYNLSQPEDIDVTPAEYHKIGYKTFSGVLSLHN